FVDPRLPREPPPGLRLLVLAPYSASDAAPTGSGSESSSTPIHDQAPLSPCIFLVAPSTDSSRSSWPSCARCVIAPVTTASKNIALPAATCGHVGTISTRLFTPASCSALINAPECDGPSTTMDA